MLGPRREVSSSLRHMPIAYLMSSCPVVKKEIAADVVYEDEHCLVFRDVSPQAPVHCLSVSRWYTVHWSVQYCNDATSSATTQWSAWRVRARHMSTRHSDTTGRLLVLLQCSDSGSAGGEAAHLSPKCKNKGLQFRFG